MIKVVGGVLMAVVVEVSVEVPIYKYIGATIVIV